MAACKLAAKGRTMADSSYDTEVQNLRQLLKMQSTGSGGSHDGEYPLKSFPYLGKQKKLIQH